MLVLIDGRTVYNNIFSGVFWDVHDYPIDDIDRIEVIKGPGGTIWGANAVHGVINIITKHSLETSDSLVVLGSGNKTRNLTTLRHGTDFNDGSAMRIFAHNVYTDAYEDPSGVSAEDNTNRLQVGFRYDAAHQSSQDFTLIGQVYNLHSREISEIPVNVDPFFVTRAKDLDDTGGHIMAKYRNSYSETSTLNLSTYVDYIERNLIYGRLKILTVDTEAQYDLALGDLLDFSTGAAWRFTEDQFQETPSIAVSLDPTSRQLNLMSFFAQLGWNISPSLKLTVGSKVEHNFYTGFEFEPNLRLLYKLSERQSLWTSISRAIRMPSRFESDIRFNAGPIPALPGAFQELRGSPDVNSENMISLEAGYRGRLFDWMSLDISTYNSWYSDLTLLTSQLAESNNSIITIPLSFQSGATLVSHGFEVSSVVQPQDWLQTEFGLSYLGYNIEDASPDLLVHFFKGFDPRYIGHAKSRFDLGESVDLDITYYYVDEVSGDLFSAGGTPAYHRVDTRLGWDLNRAVNISLTGDNLNDSNHTEFGSTFGTGRRTNIPRSFFGKLTYSW